MAMAMRTEELGDGLWAIVLVQGSITLTSVIEALVGGLSQGVFAAPVVLLTLGAAILALASARGLRLRKSWAKRVTLLAESLLLLMGLVGIALAILTRAQIGLMPVLTTLLVPAAVIILLARNRKLFTKGGA